MSNDPNKQSGSSPTVVAAEPTAAEATTRKPRKARVWQTAKERQAEFKRIQAIEPVPVGDFFVCAQVDFYRKNYHDCIRCVWTVRKPAVTLGTTSPVKIRQRMESGVPHYLPVVAQGICHFSTFEEARFAAERTTFENAEPNTLTIDDSAFLQSIGATWKAAA